MKWYHNGVTDIIMSVMLTSVSHDTVISNKHEERTRHYYVIFQHLPLPACGVKVQVEWMGGIANHLHQDHQCMR